jgi:hypothetical protein
VVLPEDGFDRAHAAPNVAQPTGTRRTQQ